jgi:hypothetical protein
MVRYVAYNAKSDDYFRWAKNVIMFLILPVLNSFELKE